MSSFLNAGRKFIVKNKNKTKHEMESVSGIPIVKFWSDLRLRAFGSSSDWRCWTMVKMGLFL